MTCKYKLEDLANGQGCDAVMSGVKTVLLGLVDDIAVWPEEVAAPTSMEENVKLVGLPVMKAGKRLFKLYSKNDAGEYQCVGQREEGSRSQQAKLQVYNPGFRAQINGFLRAVQNAQLVLFVLTNQGEWHVMGDRYRGATLEDFTATSGKAVTDPNGVDMTFVYNTPSDRVIELTDAQVEALCSVVAPGTPASAQIEAEYSAGDLTVTGTVDPGADTVLGTSLEWSNANSELVRQVVVELDSNNEFSFTGPASDVGGNTVAPGPDTVTLKIYTNNGVRTATTTFTL